MLVLSRKIGEKLLIGDNIHVSVVALQGGAVRLGITAPESIRVLREEIVGKPKPKALGDPAGRQEAMRGEPALV